MNPPFASLLPLLLLTCVSASAVLPDPLPKAPEPIADILRLQIFLDTQLFGPGKLDGRPGEFTTKALKRYEKSHGLPETEVENNTLDLSSVPALYTTCTLRPEGPQVRRRPAAPAVGAEQKEIPALRLPAGVPDRALSLRARTPRVSSTSP